MRIIAAIAAFTLWHRPGGKPHRQKRHGWWSKKAYKKFRDKREKAKKRLGWK